MISNMTSSSMIPQVQYQVEQLFYFPTREQVPMYLRPYVFNTDSAAIEQIGDRMLQNNAASVTPGILTGIAGGIVQPSTVGVESGVNAQWVGQDRYIFMLKARYIDFVGVEHCCYVFGYTDYNGVSPSGAPDINMVHYINNVLETSVETTQTPLGIYRQEKLLGVYNTIYSTTQNDYFTQRPVDIYNTFTMNEMANFGGLDAKFMSASSVITPFSNNVVSSTSENAITTEYLGKLLTSGMHAFKGKEVHVNAYEMGSNDPAEKFFSEPSINDCQFLRTLSRNSGFRNPTGNFTFNALMGLDPTIYHRFEVFNLTSDFSNPVLTQTPQVGEYWHGQDVITIKAYAFLTNAVAMATKYGFTKLSFRADNRTDVLGSVMYGILDFKSFLSVQQRDINYLVEMFKDRFTQEVFLNETNACRMSAGLECHVDLLGTSKIYLEFAGYQGKWFTVPTYANSMFRPEVTPNQEMVEHAANCVGQALNQILHTEQQAVQYY